MRNERITRWLEQTNGTAFSLFAVVAAFSTYFCMYAFRKPFTAGLFADQSLWGIDFKIVLIIAQVIGYTLSKFIGIKVISEMRPGRRAGAILGLIGLAELALLLFALTPPPYNAVFLFANGLPLGMIWGLVFSFLEGRRFTEVLGVGLASSFIVSSGVVKATGRYLIDTWGVTEFWMPFATGLVFAGPLVFFVWMLQHLPPPNAEDIARRTERVPMSGADRMAYFKAMAGGLSLLVVFHMILTAFRDFRDNFAVEILSEIGYGDRTAYLAQSEIPVAVGVLAAMAFLVRIRSNRVAFDVVHAIMLAGILLGALVTFGFQQGWIPPFTWFILVGLSLYLAYVPFQCILFDRMVALFERPANAGFLIYIADATGYLGSVLVMLYKNFGAGSMSWLDFFVRSNYFLAVAGAVMLVGSYLYYARALRQPRPSPAFAGAAEPVA